MRGDLSHLRTVSSVDFSAEGKENLFFPGRFSRRFGWAGTGGNEERGKGIHLTSHAGVKRQLGSENNGHSPS